MYIKENVLLRYWHDLNAGLAFQNSADSKGKSGYQQVVLEMWRECPCKFVKSTEEPITSGCLVNDHAISQTRRPSTQANRWIVPPWQAQGRSANIATEAPQGARETYSVLSILFSAQSPFIWTCMP